MTIGELKRLISRLPDTMEVRAQDVCLPDTFEIRRGADLTADGSMQVEVGGVDEPDPSFRRVFVLTYDVEG